jgi:Bacteriophage tail sheath protein
MPRTPEFPGVFIDETPAGARPISGVATSITAFIGRAKRGPIDSDDASPVAIGSFAEFERIFGGLWLESPLGFAVRDFFLNGGTQAVVVRLYHTKDSTRTRARLNGHGLVLEAVNPGTWGNQIRARIDHRTAPLANGSPDPETFNLSIRDGTTRDIEVFKDVSVKRSHARRVDKMLESLSKLVRTVAPLPRARPKKHPEPLAGQDVWKDNANATCARVESSGEASDGDALQEGEFTGAGKQTAKQGLFALDKIDLFNLLCIAGYKKNDSGSDVDASLISSAAKYCEARRAMLLVDAPSTWRTAAEAQAGIAAGIGTTSANAALFFPRLRQPNPGRQNQMDEFAPSGAVAGVIARTDSARGIWKAPAGLEATLSGVPELTVHLTDAETGELTSLAINCLRALPGAGRVVWGSRTLQGSNRLASEWKYIPVRRLALFLEESLYRGTKWAVFEPNAEPLWAQIRVNVGAFLSDLFRAGAFQGTTPRDAYFVKCDSETTTQNDINRGVVNIVVGFAPLKPAEFVTIKIQQIAAKNNGD